LGGAEVACLAIAPTPSIIQAKDEILKSFSEVGLNTNMPKKRALWLLIRFYLKLILLKERDPIWCASELVDIDISFGEITLFDRPDCDLYFAGQRKKYPNYTSSKFVGQEIGIEILYGLHDSLDDYPVLTQKDENHVRDMIITEAKNVLDRFYSVEPNDLND
ncbi:MAG: hypothetical protein L3J04_10170, partial [Robiginitomaculum sp.]|nr:hypothetical protein [Robiginitomaculum sp.]